MANIMIKNALIGKYIYHYECRKMHFYTPKWPLKGTIMHFMLPWGYNAN